MRRRQIKSILSLCTSGIGLEKGVASEGWVGLGKKWEGLVKEWVGLAKGVAIEGMGGVSKGCSY